MYSTSIRINKGNVLVQQRLSLDGQCHTLKREGPYLCRLQDVTVNNCLSLKYYVLLSKTTLIACFFYPQFVLIISTLVSLYFNDKLKTFYIQQHFKKQKTWYHCTRPHRQKTHTYRFCQLQHISPVCDGTAVTGVSHKRTWQKHWTQVITIQHIYGQCGSGCTTLAWIWSSILHGQRDKEKQKEILNQSNTFQCNGQYCVKTQQNVRP